MGKKRLLFLDHIFHKHTKSSLFIQNLFAKEYVIDIIYLDPENLYVSADFQKLKEQHYNLIVVWQLMPSLNWLKKYISWDKVAFFPMYDGIPPLNDIIWKEYRKTKIISFSKTLQRALKARGFDVKYIQYFPKVHQITNWGKIDSVFYWQRVNTLPVQKILNVIQDDIAKIHIHTSLDPSHVEVPLKIDKAITRSRWFKTKEDLYNKMLESSIYIAPRLSEGIGMSFLEAMSMGRCVIAPNQPTMNEYIQNEKNGFLYSLNDISKLKISGIREIQKRSFSYIKKGSYRWEKNKYKILKWVGSRIRSSFINYECQFFLFGKIPLLGWRKK